MIWVYYGSRATWVHGYLLGVYWLVSTRPPGHVDDSCKSMPVVLTTYVKIAEWPPIPMED